MRARLTRWISMRRLRWPYWFRWLVVVVATLSLVIRAPLILAADFQSTFALVALIALSHLVPVARSKERMVTFSAAAAYSASILLNGVAAGWWTLATYLGSAVFVQKGGRGYAAFVGAQHAIACQVAGAVMVAMRGRPALQGTPTVADAFAVGAAGLAFIAVNAVFIVVGNLGTRYARRKHIEPLFKAEIIAYGTSFPLAAMMALAYRTFGVVAIPGLLALAAACVGAVRMTVENRVQRRQLSAIQTLGDSCAYSVRPELPLQTFLNLARDLVDFDRAVVWMSGEIGADLSPLAVFPEGAPLPPAADAGPNSMVALAMTRRSPIMIDNAKVDVSPAGSFPAQSWLIFPLAFNNQVIGVSRFVRSASRPFTRVDSSRLAALLPHVSVAFESAQIRQQMVRYAGLATTDSLTGLINHRRCHEILREEYARAVRYNRSLAVMMVDVDSFKQFNDTFGHPQGDVLLRSLAGVLRSSVRITDYVGRYGGEEFIVILPETDRTHAWLLADRLCRLVAETPFETGSDRTVQRTVSIGVAAFPEDATEPTILVQLADDALYRAKRAGKNRAVPA